jgi:protocatechuate 3,4-dioxygenase beta subunit
MQPHALDRRALLAGAGALGCASLLQGRAAAAPLRTPSLAAARSVLRAVCPLIVQQVEGPYYLDLDLLKQDITEGKPGLPVTLIFQVVDAATCAPRPGAVVDVWHNDALGVYSGFLDQGTLGQTFLRGIQVANGDGLVVFQTIYPGWYPTRTTHMHVKVRPDAFTEATTQVYFDDPLSSLVYQLIPPYTAHGPKPTTNPADPFFAPAMKVAWIPNPDHSLSLWAGTILGLP